MWTCAKYGQCCLKSRVIWKSELPENHWEVVCFSLLYIGKHVYHLRGPHTLAIKTSLPEFSPAPPPTVLLEMASHPETVTPGKKFNLAYTPPPTSWGNWRYSEALLPMKIFHFSCDRSPCHTRTTWRNRLLKTVNVTLLMAQRLHTWAQK